MSDRTQISALARSQSNSLLHQLKKWSIRPKPNQKHVLRSTWIWRPKNPWIPKSLPRLNGRQPPAGTMQAAQVWTPQRLGVRALTGPFLGRNPFDFISNLKNGQKSFGVSDTWYAGNSLRLLREPLRPRDWPEDLLILMPASNLLPQWDWLATFPLGL